MTTLKSIALQWQGASHKRFTFVNMFLRFMPPFVSGFGRTAAYRFAGLRVDKTAFIMGNITLIGGEANHVANVSIGPHVNLSTNVTINCDAPVEIHEGATIGPYVKLYTSSHDLGPGSQRCQPEVVSRPIVIEKGCWIAVGAIILPGVTVGHGSVVSAGAVVEKDVPPDSYVAGVPAVVIRKLPLGNR